MNWKDVIRQAFIDAGDSPDEDVVEELAQHAATAYQAYRADGDEAPDAERRVRALIQQWRDQAPRFHRRSRGTPATEPPSIESRRFAGLMNDVRYGLRTLFRQRGFTLLAVLTMAIGIGIMTTLFSVLYGVLLKPLPWPEAERLMWLAESHQGATRKMPWSMTNGPYLAWKEKPSTVEDVGAWSGQTITLSGTGQTERISAAKVTASIFPLLRATPLIGAAFDASDELAGTPVGKIVLSYGLWQERFGGSAAAVGQTIQIDGKPAVIVGVMPRDFVFPNASYRAWMPFYVPPVIGSDGQTRTAALFNAITRLRPGVTPSQAAAEATARARAGGDFGMLTMMWFGTNTPADISVVPALDAITEDVRTALIALFLSVALLLITATANIASLQLARAIARRREIAIRSAIGAGTGRITQQLLVENLLLCIVGGVCGLFITAVLHQTLPSLLSTFPRLDNVRIGAMVTAFAFGLMLITGVALGVLPSLYLRRMNLAEMLSQDGTSTIGLRKGSVSRARTLIMTAQVSVACVLLVGAALLGRSLLAMMHTERGYDPANAFTARVVLPSGKFNPAAQVDAMETLSSRLRLIPGVTRVGFADSTPLSGSEMISAFDMKSKRPPVGETINVHSTRHVVSDDYFAALGIRTIQGRTFTAADAANSARVVVVNRKFAREYLSDSPLSDTLSGFGRDDGIDYQVIGIVDDVMEKDLAFAVQPEIYSLARQAPALGAATTFIVRTSGDPRLVLDPLKNMVRDVDASIAIDRIATLADRVSTSLAKPRLYAILLATFAGSALLIAAVGLFGVLSYSVAQRTREFAIRTALGAKPIHVVRMILRQGLWITGSGLAIGMWLSYASNKYLSSLLYAVTPYDWLSFVGVSLVIGVCAIVACIAPVVRALRIDPLGALRTS